MEFRILGPLEVVDGDRQVALGGCRQRALLALLLTRANEVVSTDRLIDQLWADEPPRTAANTLQLYVRGAHLGDAGSPGHERSTSVHPGARMRPATVPLPVSANPNPHGYTRSPGTRRPMFGDGRD